MEDLCITCNENEAINGFYCWGCGIDLYYSDMVNSELTLDWKD